MVMVLSSTICKSQIVVDKAGDGWDLKVDTALALIKKTDSIKYRLLIKVCDKITFWSGTFSTNEGEKGKKGAIIISSADAKASSINNIAAVIIHESLHLYMRYNGVEEKPEEEIICYSYEYEFLTQVPKIESYLLEHCLRQIRNVNR